MKEDSFEYKRANYTWGNEFNDFNNRVYTFDEIRWMKIKDMSTIHIKKTIQIMNINLTKNNIDYYNTFIEELKYRRNMVLDSLL